MEGGLEMRRVACWLGMDGRRICKYEVNNGDDYIIMEKPRC